MYTPFLSPKSDVLGRERACPTRFHHAETVFLAVHFHNIPITLVPNNSLADVSDCLVWFWIWFGPGATDAIRTWNWFLCLIQPSEFTHLWFSVDSWHESFDHLFQIWCLFDMLFWTDDHIYPSRHLVVIRTPELSLLSELWELLVFFIPYSSLLRHHNIKICRDRNMLSRSSEAQRWWGTIRLG